MEHKKLEESTPSSGKNRLVERVRISNIHCDSPFRLLPNIPKTPAQLYRIRNPFESPLIDRLHLPVCSPGLFAKSSPKNEEKFKWTICEISNMKPAEIDTNSYLQSTTNSLDPQVESLIQDKISVFFTDNTVVPSPAPRPNVKKLKNILPHDSNQDKQESLGIKKLDDGIDLNVVDISNISDEEIQNIPDDAYFKLLFGFETQSPKSSPPSLLLDSPVQFSPPREWKVKSCSDEMDKKLFKECALLSPITPENETSERNNSKNSVRDFKSVCRLDFSGNNFVDSEDQQGIQLNICRKSSFENTIKESELVSTDSEEISLENSGILSNVQGGQENDYENMEISLIHTPKTGIFISQRKRLSDSFKDLHDSFSLMEGINESITKNRSSKSVLFSEGSSDTGYNSTNIAPSISENTWNNSNVFSSTPTKNKK